MKKADTRVHEETKSKLPHMISAPSYDISFLHSNMQIKGNRPIYDTELKKTSFRKLGVRHEGKSKLVLQMRNTHKNT